MSTERHEAGSIGDLQGDKHKLFLAIWTIDNEDGKIDSYVAKRMAEAFYRLGANHALDNPVLILGMDGVGNGEDQP